MDVRLESWNPDDREALEDLYANTDQQHCLVQILVPLMEPQTSRYLQAVRDHEVDGKPFICFAVIEQDKIIGKIELTRSYGEKAELDLVIRKEYMHQGYGYEALRLLITTVSGERWCSHIFAYTVTDNEAMIALLEKCGFRKGRRFKADVMVPYGGMFTMMEKTGIEYFLQV